MNESNCSANLKEILIKNQEPYSLEVILSKLDLSRDYNYLSNCLYRDGEVTQEIILDILLRCTFPEYYIGMSNSVGDKFFRLNNYTVYFIFNIN